MDRKIGKFEVVERLGRGGMAEVYRAYHASLDRYVAIKVLHTFLADAPEFRTRFEREARHIARLKHANIVQVYDFDYDEPSESYYMVMELIDGLSLKDRLYERQQDGGYFTLDETLRIVGEAASALAYAHGEGMIHRDVKPANLMLDKDNRLVLTDFGIAKLVTNPQLTATGGMVGTPAYMSPEQGMGDLGDERSDLYSLGIIMYEMLAGNIPYNAETPLALILKHVNEPIPSILTVRPELPKPVDQIIAKLLAKDPQDRYQNAGVLIADIEKLKHHLKAGNRPKPIARAASDVPAQTTHTREVTQPTRPLGLSEALAQQTRSVSKPQPSADAVRSGFRWPLLILLILLLVTALVGGYLVGTGAVPLIATAPTNTPSETPTATLEPTSTPTFTLTPTVTSTSTATSTSTPTVTDTPTLTATSTSTPTATIPEPMDTPTETFTPSETPNMTLTLAAIQTATIAACDFDYAIIEHDPLDGEDGGFFTVNSPYSREITLLNIGTCAWPPNTFLNFIEGESFSAGPRIFIREQVDPTEEVMLLFSGTLPSVGSVEPMVGTWQLRTPGQIDIGDPFEISIMVYDPGN